MDEEAPLDAEQTEYIMKIGNAAVDAAMGGGAAYDDTENALFALSNAGVDDVMKPSKDKRLDRERDAPDDMNTALAAKMDVARAAAERAAGGGGGDEELEHKDTAADAAAADDGGGGRRRRRRGKRLRKPRKPKGPRKTLLETVSEAQLAKAFDRIIKDRIDQHLARVDEQIADMYQGVVALRQHVMDIREGVAVDTDAAEAGYPERLARAGAGDRTAYGVSAAAARPPGAPPPTALEEAAAKLDRAAAQLKGEGGRAAAKKARRGRVNAAAQAMRLQRKQQQEREASRRKADADARKHNKQRGGLYGGGGTSGKFAKPRSRATTAPPPSGAIAEKAPPRKRVVEGDGGTFWVDLTVLSEGQQGKVHGPKGVCPDNCCRGVCPDPHLEITIGHYSFLELLKFHRAQNLIRSEKSPAKRKRLKSKLKVCTIGSFHRQGLVKFTGRLDVVRALDIWVLKWMMTIGSGQGTKPEPPVDVPRNT